MRTVLSLIFLTALSLPHTVLRAAEDVVVIANRAAPVDKINADQATQIFMKQVQSWPDGQSIHPIDIKEGTPQRTEFYAKVTGRSLGQLRAYWARQTFTGMGFPPKQANSTDEAVKLVQTTPGAVGYVNRKQVDTSVKVVLDPAL
jgi:ABC-type phosphate transport system substrate-binding protein